MSDQSSHNYLDTRARLETYFDKTASQTWAALTSDAPVSKIRATVRAGRDEMRAMLLDALPADLSGARVLDAGAGAGQMSFELAARGAEVVAVDISPSLLEVARKRMPAEFADKISFHAGDMLDPVHGRFDYAIAMDSVIHYRAPDMARMLGELAPRVWQKIAFTIAPQTPMLSAMHVAGKAFPRSDRSPAIIPISENRLRLELAKITERELRKIGRVHTGFYISQAMEVCA